MEKSYEVPGVETMPKGADHKCFLLGLNLQLLFLFGSVGIGGLINSIINIPFKGELNGNVPAISLFLHTGVHLEIPDV